MLSPSDVGLLHSDLLCACLVENTFIHLGLCTFDFTFVFIQLVSL